MIQYPRKSWWHVVFSYRGTVLKNIVGRVLVMTLFATAVEALYATARHFEWLGKEGFGLVEPAGFAVFGSLLGFLIVFRMNWSAGRYWEGRSHWGMMINSTRSLVRCGAVYAHPAHELSELIGGYVLSVKHTLRDSRDLEELRDHLPKDLYTTMVRFGNHPTAVAGAISMWIATRLREGRIDSILAQVMEDLLTKMVDSQGGCEKIKKTPLPFVYAAMIKQLILVYLAFLPLVLCGRTGWWSPLIVAIISFGFFGIEEAGVEIEDPFGMEDNCLPLDAICVGIIRDTAQIAQSFPVATQRPDADTGEDIMRSMAITSPRLKT